MQIQNVEVEVISVRKYTLIDRDTKQPREMLEVVFKSKEGEIFRVSKRPNEDAPIEVGHYTLDFQVIPDETLKPRIGTIHF